MTFFILFFSPYFFLFMGDGKSEHGKCTSHSPQLPTSGLPHHKLSLGKLGPIEKDHVISETVL